MIRENVNFNGWPNCIRLSNEKMELIVTTDIGPRIISAGFIDGTNLLFVSPGDSGKTGGDQWRIYGGHRFWHAPEHMPRTYFPDNNAVGYSWNGKILHLVQDTEGTTGIRKEMEIGLDPLENKVTILHRLVNNNLWDIEISAWAITAMAKGGRAVLPQEPYVAPAHELLPSRPVVLWHYTQMGDPRWRWGNKYIQLKQDPSLVSEQKIGILNKQGWVAYFLNQEVFVKRFDFNPDAVYPDYGSNNEVYVNGDFLEVETLGPVNLLVPGGSLEHTEHWFLAKFPDIEAGYDEDGIDRLVYSLIENAGNDHPKNQT